MKSQQTEIMDSEVNCDPRPAPEGKYVTAGGIEISCKYRPYGPKSIKKEVRADFQTSFVIIFVSFLHTYRKTSKIL